MSGRSPQKQKSGPRPGTRSAWSSAFAGSPSATQETLDFLSASARAPRRTGSSRVKRTPASPRATEEIIDLLSASVREPRRTRISRVKRTPASPRATEELIDFLSASRRTRSSRVKRTPASPRASSRVKRTSFADNPGHGRKTSFADDSSTEVTIEDFLRASARAPRTRSGQARKASLAARARRSSIRAGGGARLDPLSVSERPRSRRSIRGRGGDPLSVSERPRTRRGTFRGPRGKLEPAHAEVHEGYIGELRVIG